MNRFLNIGFYLTACAAGLMVAPIASADCGRVVHRARRVVRNVVVHKAVEVVNTVAIAEYVPLAVLVPSYSISYAPQIAAQQQQVVQQQQSVQQPQADDAVRGLQAQIVDLQKQLLECKKALLAKPVPQIPKVDDDEGTQQQPPQKEANAAKPAYLTLLANKCAVCHEAKIAEENGGGFAMFNGGTLAKLTSKQLLRMSSKTYQGAMPPKNNKKNISPLTDEEVGVIQDWLASAK